MKYLWEKFANYIANVDGTLHEKLKPHVGKAIRIKTAEPYRIFYLLIRENDFHFTSEFDGDEDVRVRLPFRVLIMVALGVDRFHSYNPDIKIEGDGDLIYDLVKAMESASIWSTVKGVLGCFVPDISSVEDLLKMALGHEPEWVRRLERAFGEIPQTQQHILEMLVSMEDHSERKLFLTKEISKELTRIRRLLYVVSVAVASAFLYHLVVNVLQISFQPPAMF